MQQLRRAGASYDVVDYEYEETPLVRACDEGRLDVVRLLLDAGVDVTKLRIWATRL